MIASAKAMAREEMSEAAEYFSRLKPAQNIKVVEAGVVPRTHVEGWRLSSDSGKETEALGARIVELPDRADLFESRDSRATFTAYVPIGSLALGRALVQGGRQASTTPCISCHGADLGGTNLAPPLAGRSPSYLVRQLLDIQSGARNGLRLGAMKAVLPVLQVDDVIAIAAYSASLPP